MGRRKKYFARKIRRRASKPTMKWIRWSIFTEGQDFAQTGGRFAVITYHSLEDRLKPLKQVTAEKSSETILETLSDLWPGNKNRSVCEEFQSTGLGDRGVQSLGQR